MWALECVGCEGIANDVLRGACLESLNEFVVDALLDVDTRAGAAALAMVEENTEIDPADSIFNVGVVEDDVGALATKLESNLLQIALGGSLEDGSADDGGASEGDLVNIHVRCNGCVTTGQSLAARGD